MNRIPALLLISYLAIMFFLTAKISFLSVENGHPDEKYHILSSKYYLNHSLPPQMEDPEIRNTYSREGYSRLNDLDPTYFLSGKIAKVLLAAGFKDHVWIYRFFNLLLLFILCIRMAYLIATNSSRFWIYCLFLCSAQLWYTFGYHNDDTFPIITSFLIIELMSSHTQNLKIFILIGLSIGLLFISKTNYWVLILFTGVILITRFFQQKNYKMLLIPVIALVVISGRYGMDYLINEGNRFENIEQMRQQTAHEGFEPDGPWIETIRMKDQGVGIKEMLFKYQWPKTSIQSFFGVFGKMDIFLANWFYWTSFLAFLFLVGYYSFMVFRKKIYHQSMLLVWTLFCSFFLIILSFINSWVIDFQAQGRYLFPIIIMGGYLTFRTYEKKDLVLKVSYLTTVFLALSAYVYITFSTTLF